MKLLGVILTRITILLRVAWLLFPAIIFLFILCQCIWFLPQGLDVVITTLEKLHTDKIGWILLIALLFWVMVTWYSSRVLIYRKSSLYENSKTIGFHAPRLLGFLGFSIAWIAILLVKVPETGHLPTLKNSGKAWLWLILSIAAYIVLYYLFKWLRDSYLLPAMHDRLHTDDVAQQSVRNITTEERKEHRMFTRVYVTVVAGMLLLVMLNYFFSGAVMLFWSIILMQVLFLFLVIIRRGRLPYNDFPLESGEEEWLQRWAVKRKKWEPKFFGKVLYNINVSMRERIFFYTFNLFSLIAFFFYFRAILDMDYAVSIGTFALVLLAFGVLVGFFALISVLTLIKKINFHFVLLVVVLILAETREPHYVRSTDAKTPSYLHSLQRPNLTEYFSRWTQQRKTQIAQSAEYPVFFVLGDGGASRSGYWVAAALGKLEDGSQGKFSQHLFCLSGASGGVVGEGAFFALLHNKAQMSGRSYEKDAKDILKNDFLSFTIARMLGPDFFRPLIPLYLRNVKDRAGTLEASLERGMSDTVFLKNKLSVPFSVLVPGRNDTIVQLPVFCINTTRMQDGRPGVISNINIHNVNERDSAFGPRLDVLDFTDTGKDLRLSTALILGSRFPYISPAGRIDERIRSSKGKPDSARVHYFVDGGYFDNSGAGIVHEMLLELQEIIKTKTADPANAYLDKLKFYVIHITNNPLGNIPIHEVNYLSNDLLSPAITLFGAYNRQTDVNDWRLRKHLQMLYKTVSDTQYYKRIDLYKGVNPARLNFPMNWAISNYYQKKMDSLLNNSRQATTLGNWMNTLD